LKNNNEYVAGFAWRPKDRTTKNTGYWLRDLAIALWVAVAASLLCMIGDAYAECSVGIAGTDYPFKIPVGQP
jgi:hypothetical protein